MIPAPLPPIPWQITGNHWVTIPCIHPADGSIHAVGVLHRGARAAIEFAGSPDFVDGTGKPLLTPAIRVAGTAVRFDEGTMAWERALAWLPTFTASHGDVRMRGTIFAPVGRDSDLPGAVYALSIENRGGAAVRVDVELQGTLGHRQQRVRTPRPFDDDHLVSVDGQRIVLEGSARPGLAALAIGCEGEATALAVTGDVAGFLLTRTVEIASGAREQIAFHLAAAPERDGALATVEVMRRRGWRTLLATTRDALGELEQSTGNEAVDRLINRNLLFAYFGAVGRALDDAHFYVVRSRIPWHPRGITVREWEALLWLIPAIQLADPSLARELLLRMCEVHGYAPGRGVHYLDGALFEPGISLEGIAAYPVAIDRYIRETGDDQIVEEPAIADTLYVCHEELAPRRERDIPLYSTEVSASGAPATHPYTLHGNALVALALDVLRRTLDEETARDVEDPAAVRAALTRHFAIDHAGKKRFAATIDLAGAADPTDDPAGSLLWLPLYEAVAREDSTYRRTVKALSGSEQSLAWRCAQLLGPDSSKQLEWIRRAPIENGLAAESIDGNGAATGSGGDATLSGLLAWTAWYAVHGLGAAPA